MDSGVSDEHELVVAELDELSHAECLTLYSESAESIRFAKSQQWKTLVYLTAVFFSLVILPYTRLAPPDLLPYLIVISFVVSACGVSMLIIFQMWQSTEHRKLDLIGQEMSDLFREVRGVKSTLEANIHRYLLLAFMIVFIAAANGITYMVLALYLDP